MGWNPYFWDVKVLSKSSQHITCSAYHKQLRTSFTISFIYGFNTAAGRRQLWLELYNIAQLVGNSPWVLFGDFNVYFDVTEKYGGHVYWKPDMGEFKECTLKLGLTDLRFDGHLYTWWNSSLSMPKYRKLDRVMVNSSWLPTFDMSSSTFLSRGFSDHCPLVTDLGLARVSPHKPFKCSNFICEHSQFLPTVSQVWATSFNGDPWHVLAARLKLVKSALKSLNNIVGDIHSRVIQDRDALSNFQTSMNFPSSEDELNYEKDLVLKYKSSFDAEESFLKQKSRVQWLHLGDNNSKFFFNSCRQNWNVNKIVSLADDDGQVHHTHNGISNVAIAYFKGLYGSSAAVSPIPEDLQMPVLSQTQCNFLSRPFSTKDILDTLKTMSKSKSPGPDGFTPEFYITAWRIVGPDVEKAILHFFDYGFLPRFVNSTAVTLVPKVKNPSRIQDFRPISCCNALYKCISKMLSKRLQLVFSR